MWNALIAWYYNLESKQFTGTQVRNILIAVGVALILLKIMWYFLFDYGTMQINKKEYQKQTKENQKIIQQALSRAETAEKKAAEYAQQAEHIKQLNDQRSKKASEKDKITDAKIEESDIIRKQEVKEIETNYEKDVNNINSMSDDERRADICARIKKLAESDPSFNDYRCP